MSFRLFIYYCALCGAWAALLAWGFAWTFTQPDGVWTVSKNQTVLDALQGVSLGLLVAMALGMVDGLWNLTGRRYASLLSKGLLVGIVGGLGALAGSVLGSLLVQWTRQAIFVIAGWTLTGLLIGMSVGLFDFLLHWRKGDKFGGARRKLLHGLFGGTIGGFFGGLLFVMAGWALSRLLRKPEEDLLSSGAGGFVAVGSCIGLFIGLAQVVFKEAWIKVESGRHAGRELILTKDETSIGRAESCDIGLFGDAGIERRHAHILRSESRYLLTDAGSASGTFLNELRVAAPMPLHSGDAIRIGSCLLRFREKQKKQR